MPAGIYEIVNLENGKRYIGSAKNFARRWVAHRSALRANRHANRHLQAAWLKHGESSFAFREIEVCEVERLIEREQAAIDAGKPEYNLSPTAGSSLGVKFTETQRKNISAALKGRPMPPRSQEHRRNMSAALKGRPKPPEVMAKLQEGRRRHAITAAEKQRRSEYLKSAYAEGLRDRARPPEYREKIAASLRGRKATPEARAKQAAAQLGKKRGPYKKRPASV